MNKESYQCVPLTKNCIFAPEFKLHTFRTIDKIWGNISDPGKVRDQQVHNMGEC